MSLDGFADERMQLLTAVPPVDINHPVASKPSSNNSFVNDHWRTGQRTMSELMATALFTFMSCSSVQTLVPIDDPTLDSAKVMQIAFTQGVMIFAIILAFERISGAHINPAVTLGMFIADRSFKLVSLVTFVAAQLVGAVIGASMLKLIFRGSILHTTKFGAHQLQEGYTVGNGVALEIILTFLLVLVILRVALESPSSPVAPLAVACVVVADVFIGLPITGASMNPARSFGPALVAETAWANHWIYWVGPLTGAVLAALVYRSVFRHEMHRLYAPN